MNPDARLWWVVSDLASTWRSEEHTSELQSHLNLVCRLLLEKKKKKKKQDSLRFRMYEVPCILGHRTVVVDIMCSWLLGAVYQNHLTSTQRTVISIVPMPTQH